MKKVTIIRKEEEIGARVGDVVKVIDTGKVYTTYGDWFLNNKFYELGCRYVYGISLGDWLESRDMNEDTEFKVLAVASHNIWCNEELVAITLDNTIEDQVFLIGTEGLEFVR